jgi:membrane-anchored protein YejM (alkaline phosphatase superfamily)
MEDLKLNGITLDRLEDRRALLTGFDQFRREIDSSGLVSSMDAFNQQALNVLTSNKLLAALDLGKETVKTRERYGKGDPKNYGDGAPLNLEHFLLARRLVERGSRFIQLYHTNWDSHGGPGENLQSDFEARCREVDQGQAALVTDLKQRGLLKDTLVVWGGEFGRTPMGENRDTTGRNHHIDAFTMWFAGGGTKPGTIIGETDELGFNAVTDRAHVHDIHATILHLLGIDHKKLTFRFQGRDFRLTDVHGHLIEKLLA